MGEVSSARATPFGGTVRLLGRLAGPRLEILATGGGMAAFQLATFALAILLARSLGPEGLGQFQIVVATSVGAALLCKCGYDEALAYQIPRTKVEDRGPLTMFAITVAGVSGLVGGGVVAAIIVALEPGFAAAIPDHVWWAVPWLTCATCLLAVALGALRGEGFFFARAAIYYIAVGCGVLLLCSALWVAEQLTAATALLSRAAVFATAVGVTLLLLRHRGRSLSLEVPAAWRSLGRLGLWASLTSLTQYLVEQPLIDLYFASAIAGAAAAGIYAVATRVASLVVLVTAALMIVAGPKFASTTVDSRGAQFSRWSDLLVVGSSVATCLLVLSRVHLFRLFGSEYGAQAEPLFLCLIGFFAVAAGAGLNTPLLLASGHAKADFAVAAGGVILMIAAAALLSPAFGMLGIAAATGGSATVVAYAKRAAVARWTAVPVGRNDIARVGVALITFVGTVLIRYDELLGKMALGATLVAVMTWLCVVEVRRARSQ